MIVGLQPRREPKPEGLAFILLLVSLNLPASVSAESSKAFELLDRTVTTYRELGSYRDHGELVVIETSGQGVTTRRFEFTTVASDAGGYLFRLMETGNVSSQRAVWRRNGAIWHSVGGAAKPTHSVMTALTLLLGPEAIPALLVPTLLGNPDLLESPHAAALDGSESCGDQICDVLVISRQEGLSLSRVWIERETSLIRRLEVDLLPLPEGSGAPTRVRRTLSVHHDVESVDEALAQELFSTVDLESGPVSDQLEQAGDELIVRDEISVALRSLPVRALDRRGRPIRGLRAADFEVRLGKQQIPVVAADWISTGGGVPESLDEISMTPPAPLTPRNEIQGNLILFFVQADMNAVRVKGHLRILPFVREFLDALEPQDWVAVVSFDSHLKLWHDFTRDRQAIADVIEQAVRFGNMPLFPARGARALSQSFPRAEAKRVAEPEDALHLTAKSLFDIDGEKVIVYLGWGLGRFGGSGFSMTPAYDRALGALKAARASVFVLDVTDADYHTLELGIRKVARDTGGTYAKTNNFARREVLRLTEAISGYYLLTLDRESLPEERRRLRVSLRDLPGEVLMRDLQLYR